MAGFAPAIFFCAPPFFGPRWAAEHGTQIRGLLMIYSLVFAAALSGADPCALTTTVEVEAVLGAVAVDVPVSEIGEETAPYCLWATAGRASEVKLEIWSSEELPVLDMPDAATYFAKLHAEAAAGRRAMPLSGLGERAFASDLFPKASGKADGSIVVLKDGRVMVFDFTNVTSRAAQAFAERVLGRI
jgi:hypothetical protein